MQWSQFVEWRAGADAGRGHRRAASDLATWALYFASSPDVLLVLQLGFLPYQHDLVTPWHVDVRTPRDRFRPLRTSRFRPEAFRASSAA